MTSLNDLPRRTQSNRNLVRATVAQSEDLRYVLDTYPQRWSPATVAAALTLPATTREGCGAWIALLDQLDEAIHDLVFVEE